VLDMVQVRTEQRAASVTGNGYGKRTLISDYRVTHRGKGIKT
jgi:DNA gyrase/topoisomerase IV subunit A